MNQTQKRLSIIKLAISMTDIETIQQQISKLRLLKEDIQIQKIIDALESESYAHAQILIQRYINTPIQEVHQRVPNQQQGHTYSRKEQELIDQFDLFVINDNENKAHEIVDIDQYLQSSAASPKNRSVIDLDKLLEIDENEPKANEEHVVHREEDPLLYWNDTQAEETTQKTDGRNEDLLEEEKRWATLAERAKEERVEVSALSEEQETETKAEMVTASEETAKCSEVQELSGGTVSTSDSDTKYRPIFSIEQQFHDASKKYPMLAKSRQPYDSVKRWIGQITDEHGYTKSDVENVVAEALKLAEGDSPSDRSEAAELLLLSGLTENEFGQLILSRELFRGRLFEKNIPEAYKRIEQLAVKEYPEAICDLAQFYEYGIEAKKNKKRAKALYEKAMHFGIKRAQRHFERLNEDGGFFSL